MSRLFSFIVCAALLMAFAPRSSDSGDKQMHARSAFQFAARKDWQNALAHAKDDGDPALLTLITWEYALDPDSGASFEDITRFISKHPNWPAQKRLKIRAELSLRDVNVDADTLNTWFGEEPPITGVGKIALATALMSAPNPPQDKIRYLVREAWKDGDFEEPQEKIILADYGSMLQPADDIARISRLLWEEKIAPAKRILSRVPTAYQHLFEARMALIEDKTFAGLRVARVDAKLTNDPGLIYDRMLYRARRDDDKGVRQMLLAAPAHVPYPDKWWRLREQEIRLAIGERDYADAEKLLANHGQVDNAEVSDALWLQGWLALEFRHEPGQAYNLFSRMYDMVEYPVSRARAAYWAGRAAEAKDDADDADQWYAKAAAWPTTFFGQLAWQKHSPDASLSLPASFVASDEAQAEFEKSDLAQAVKRCVEMDQDDLASHLVTYLVESESDEQAALAATLGHRLGNDYLSVHASKKAMQHNIVLIDAGYPTPKTPSGIPIERPFALAIVRQESEFDPHAQSPSEALGLMQLRPATAKETARKAGIGYAKARLFEPGYNVSLGSRYLARLVTNYDGSYLLAIAAYNAGPGNVHRWNQKFGTPGDNLTNVLDWMEKIPFAETRNYVQRVIENLQVYRTLESPDRANSIKVDADW